jgi:hypothetical protein
VALQLVGPLSFSGANGDPLARHPFLTVKNAIGAKGVFLLFGSLTLVALLYFWREVHGD